MRGAIIGSGGREHAIVEALTKSKKLSKLFCIPGNAGISKLVECKKIDVMDFASICDFALAEKLDFVFVAPDDPLGAGLVDVLNEKGIRAFGPTSQAAIIESSKAFSKEFMKRHNIPTANYVTFLNFTDAEAYIKKANHPIVIKADGLAVGKGVYICNTYAESMSALQALMIDRAFKAAGDKVVIEEFLTGTEITLLVFCDGKNFCLMPSSQDYKRAFDGDEGPNTGGMGAICPSPIFSEKIKHETINNIVIPTISALIEEGRPFKGVIYFGLMLTKDGIKVIEYNARFGDPEAQVILPLLETDLVDIINACIDGTLDKLKVFWKNKSCMCVIIASGGYPANVIKGYPIEISQLLDVSLIHNGTSFLDDVLITNGGRVFSVVAIDDTIQLCRNKIYREIDKIKFKDARYRKDIGK